MTQLTLSVPLSELTADIIAKLKALANGNARDFEVFIRLKRKETPQEMKASIEQAMREVERGENMISFTGEEYEELVKQLSKGYEAGSV